MQTPEVHINRVGSDPRDLAALRAEWVCHPSHDPRFKDQIRAWWEVERHHRIAFGASIGDAPVGMANDLAYSRMPSPGRPSAQWLYAANVFVSPAFRRRGVAPALMTRLIEHARAEGMERIVLAPSEMSKPMYRSLGFRVADDLMRLDLIQA